MALTYSMANEVTSGNFEVDYSNDGTSQDPIAAGGSPQTGSFSSSLVIYGDVSGITKGTTISIGFQKNGNPKNFSDTMKDKNNPKTTILTSNLSVTMDPTAKTWTIGCTTTSDEVYKQSTTDVEVIVGPDGQ
jgi:hypothetical protein